MTAVQRNMFTAFIFAGIVINSITSATQVRFKRQELLPPLEMRLQDNIPGQPVLDYPIFDQVPDSAFLCSSQQHPGYYADLDARCQVFHICQFSGRQDSFLCPNGTVFDQRYFVCNWWFNVDCTLSPTFYSFNSQLFRSSDSSVLVQDVVSQDVSFDSPGSLPVPGVVGGGSVIPSAHNNLREAHSLDDSGFVPSPRDWEIASTAGSVSSWSRPSDHGSRGRLRAPVSATPGYPNEETREPDADYRRFNNVPVTTYRPLVPYRLPEMRIVNDRPSTNRYPQEEETFPEEIAPEEAGGYYSHRREVPERQSPAPDVGTVTNTYPVEEEFFSRDTFVDDATEVVAERQKPVPLTPEEAVSLMPDYDTYTSAPEPSPFDEDLNYGRKLHVPTTVTSAPAQLTSPRVQIRHQQTPIGSYPVEEDLPLEEILPITEPTPLPKHSPVPHSTRSPYYSPQPAPLPVPDPIHRRPVLAEPEVDYRSKQTLQFVSSRIPVIASNGHNNEPEVQTQTTRQALEFVSTPHPLAQQVDFRPTPNIQILSTPNPVQESSTEFSTVSVESMTRDTISFGQSYLPQVLDPQSELPVGGASADIHNGLFEYGNQKETPIRTEEAVTPGLAFQPSRRPTYPTQYSSVQEPLSAQEPSPRHPLTYPTFQTNHQNKNLNYPRDEEFIPPAIPISNSPTSTPVYSLANILEEINDPSINHNNGNHNNGNHNNGNHNNGNHNNGNHNNGNHNNGIPNNINHNGVNHNNGIHSNINHNNVNHNNVNHNNGNHNNGIPNNINHNGVNHNNGIHSNINHNNVNHNNVNHNNVNHNNENFNNVNHINGNLNNVNHNNGNLNNVNHNNINHNNINHNNGNNNNNGNQNINNHNNQFSNGFGPLEILTVDNKPVQSLPHANLMALRPTYINIRPSDGSTPTNGQLEDIVVPTLSQSLLAPYPQRGSLQNNQFGQQNPSRSPHFNRVNNNQNSLFNNNNNNNLRAQPNVNFNQFGKQSLIGSALSGVMNQYHGSNLVQGQNQNGKGKPIPSNGFRTNPRNIQPLSVPLISVPILKPIDKEWTMDKSSATKSRRFNVRAGGSRPLVIRLAADPRVPPQIEINRRIDNGAIQKKPFSNRF